MAASSEENIAEGNIAEGNIAEGNIAEGNTAEGDTARHPVTPLPTPYAIKRLLAFLPLLDRPGSSFIREWAGGKKEPIGETGNFLHTLSYPVYDENALRFFKQASKPCWTDTGYDPVQAGKWLEMYMSYSEIPARATILHIRTMLTYCVRGERFCDGHWGEMLSSGKVVKLLKGLQHITLAEKHHPGGEVG